MADGERMIEPLMSAKIDGAKEMNRKGRHFTVEVECLPCFFMPIDRSRNRAFYRLRLRKPTADQMIGFF